MLIDIRKVIFTDSELKVALLEHCQHTKVAAADASIESVAIRDDDEEMAVIQIDTGNSGRIAVVALSRNAVAAAIIRYCGARDIPLPRRSEKILKPEEGGLSLMTRIELTED